MQNFFSRVTIVTGHYGCGKTNLAVNLALDRRAAGRRVALADLDIVNPYFRSTDFATLLQRQGVELVAPVYANTNLDIPALTGRLEGLLQEDCDLILDVGGDAAGAAALGRYSAAIRKAGGYDLLYAVNFYRYLTRTAEECAEILSDIERAARLRATGVVNCSHLMDSTTPQTVADTDTRARTVAAACGLPLRFTSVLYPLAEPLRQLLPDGEFYPIDLYVKKPWE